MTDNKVQKLAYFDSRVVQKPAVYGIQKGSLSITSNKTSAVSKTSNSLSWNVQIPSLNVFVDKKVRWKSEVVLQLNVTRNDWANNGAPAKAFPTKADGQGGQVPAPENAIYALQYAKDWAFNCFPLHQCVNSMSASINDSVVTQNISETLTELLMLKEADPNFKFNHTCPSYLSKYRFYSEGYGAHNNSVSGFFTK